MTPWFFAVVLGLLMAVIAVGTVRSGLLLRTWTPPHNLLLSWPDNAVRLVLIAFCAWLGLQPGPGAAALGWGTAGLRGNVLIGVGAGIGLAALLALAGGLAVRIWGEGIYSSKTVQVILPASAAEWPGVLLALLPAALVEELIFRSLPLGGLGWLIPPYWLLWPLAMFFGFLHWPQGWWGVAGATFAAAVFSLLFLGSGSIWMPLAAHYTMNVVQIVLAGVMGVRPLRAPAPGSAPHA